MALQVWLPLNKEGDFKNKGLANISVTNSGSAYNSSGKIGGCYQKVTLNSGFQDLIDKLNTNKFSISMWVYVPSTITTEFFLFRIGYNGTDKQLYAVIRANKGNLSFDFYADAVNTASTSIFDKWTHLTFSCDGSQKYIYIDGALAVSGSTNALAIPSESTLNEKYLGASQSGAYVNDIRIYDHCLSPKEVKEISKGLVLHYPFNEDATLLTELETKILDDGSTWGKVLYHNNPSENMFTQSNCSNNDSKNLYSKLYLLTTNNFLSTDGYYEFLLNQVTESGGSVTTYRWKQTSAPASTTAITGKQDITNSIAGLCLCSGNTYLARSNSTGNWWAACGCYTKYGSGIPGVDVTISTGYLELWVRLDNTKISGSLHQIKDCSGYENNGTVTGTLSISTDTPRYDKCTVLDNNYITFKSPLPSKPSYMTTNFWYKPNSSDGKYNIICSSSGTPSAGYWISIDGETQLWMYNCSTPYVNADSSAISDGTWVMATLVYNNGTYTWYSNGVEQTTTTRSTINPPILTTNLQIGNGYTGNSWNTSTYGSISDFRMYATALSANDIQELYNTSAFITDNGVLEGYEFEEVKPTDYSNQSNPIVEKSGEVSSLYYNEFNNPLTLTGSSTTITPSAAVNQCMNAYNVTFYSNGTYQINISVEWTKFTSASGQTFSWFFQGLKWKTNSTSYYWSGNPICTALSTSSIKPNITSASGSSNLTTTFNINNVNEYNRYNIGARFDYSDGSGSFTIKSCTITQVATESTRFSTNTISANQLIEI